MNTFVSACRPSPSLACDGNPWQVDFSKPVFETQLKPGPTGPLRYGERS
jgi:hypothetical protein